MEATSTVVCARPSWHGAHRGVAILDALIGLNTACALWLARAVVLPIRVAITPTIGSLPRGGHEILQTRALHVLKLIWEPVVEARRGCDACGRDTAGVTRVPPRDQTAMCCCTQKWRLAESWPVRARLDVITAAHADQAMR